MKNDKKNVLNFKNRANFLIERASTKKALLRITQTLISEIGFSHFDITHTDQKLGVSNMVSSVPDELNSTYFSEVDYENDLTTKLVYASEKPVYCSDILAFIKASPITTKRLNDASLTHEIMRFFNFNDLFCLPYNVSEPGGKHGKIIFSVLAENLSQRDFKLKTQNEYEKIKILLKIISQKISILYSRRDMHPKAHLSETDILILKYLGPDSMQTKEIAEKINKSVAFVNTSIKKSKDALRKTTIAGLISEAHRLDIIDFERLKNSNWS